ncbi:MAG: adenylate/guanylate cyclase domain-containing protein [Kiloniellaceae bacterium]
MKRRLAAVLAADMVGYSRLMAADEDGTIDRQKALRDELIDPKIGQFGGRIVKTTGDGLLVEFASAVGAVRCAVEIQQAMPNHEAGHPEAARIRYRIGINLGDIVIDGDDILGDGVNVAARLEGIAEPGGICVSGVVFDQVSGRVDVAFEDAGHQQVKNIARPIRVWRWPPARTDGVRDAPSDAPSDAPRDGPRDAPRDAPGGGPKMLSDKPAIAVLPFTNMSADPEQEYFSDGLTEDIITALTHWHSFAVIARNSCFAYKRKAVDIKQAARDLGAGYVLEGSVRKSGTKVRVGAQLVDGASGRHLWAERYDRDLIDIFEIQDDIVQQIAAVVAPELARAELQRSTGKRTDDLNAWDLCLRGLALLRQRTREDNAAARGLFKRAIESRPDYSDAYAGLAMSHNMDILIDAAEDREGTATQAMQAARSAIEHDEGSSWAHHELSTAYQWLNRIEDALAEAKVAVDLNPNDAYALHALGNKSDLAGDPRGIDFMERAQKLNPADARLHSHLAFLARAYVNAGNHEAALERARQAIRRRPDYAPACFIAALALAHLGRLEEAKAMLDQCDNLSPGFTQARRDWKPYADPLSNRRLLEGLSRLER